MRPFLSLSLPEVPSYEDFCSLVSLQTSEHGGLNTNPSEDESKEQVLSILDIAEQAMKVGRREWEAMGKKSAEAARCQGCEDWWKGSIRDVVRASIAGSIAVATVRKGLMATGGGKKKKIKDVLKVDIPGQDKRYHSWWVVPSVILR